MSELTGKCVLVTGGGSGIGLAVARSFLEAGAKVAITGRDPDKLRRAAATLDYGDRGRAWYMQGAYDEALADLDKAIRLDAGVSRFHSLRAWIQATCPVERLRNGPAAVTSARRACELTEWKRPNPLGTLAAAYAEAGDFERAVEFQQKANELYSDGDDLRGGRARLWRPPLS